MEFERLIEIASTDCSGRQLPMQGPAIFESAPFMIFVHHARLRLSARAQIGIELLSQICRTGRSSILGL
jgi:hypothetical protein